MRAMFNVLMALCLAIGAMGWMVLYDWRLFVGGIIVAFVVAVLREEFTNA